MKAAFKMTLGAAALALAPQIAMAETEVTYSSWFPGSSTLHTKVLTPFFDRVTEATGGEVTFKVFTDGTVAGGRNTLQAIRDGVADMGLLATSYHPGELSTAAWLSEGSILVRDALVGAGAYNEMIFKHCPQCLDEMEAQGIVPIAYHATPPYKTMCNKPVETAEDMKGLRVRTFGSWASWVNAAGGNAVTMTVPEAYEGLERGQLDCVAGSAAWLIQFSLFDVVKDVSNLPIGTFAGGIPLNMNADTWGDLSAEQQTLFYKEGIAAAVDVAVEFDAEDNQALAEAGGHNVNVIEPAEDLKAAFAAFAETEVDRMKALAEQREIANADALLETYLGLLKKWEGIVDELDGDRDAIAARIYQEAMPVGQ